MRMRSAEKHLFYAEMAKLLEAGFDIRRAAEVLLNTRIPRAQAEIVNDLIAGLDAGESITMALSRNQNRISLLERNMIGAGERGGKLAPAFQHLSEYFQMLAETRREAVRSMIYPAFILHLGIGIQVVPMALMTGEKTLWQIAGNMAIALTGLYAASFAIFTAARVLVRAAPERPLVDRFLLGIPWIGKARRNLAMARFCKVYHTCLLAGLPMTETLNAALDASQSGTIQEAGKMLKATAKAGRPLGPAFLAAAAFPKSFSRSYATGEEAGTLDIDLARWAKLFRDEAQSSATTVSVMIPKILYFIILGFVAWKVTGFYNSYYNGILNELAP